MAKKIEKTFPNFETLSRIRFLILDIDGVMTDGGIVYSASGEELKSFDVKDGTGVKYWRRAGHAVGVISGRSSPAVQHCVRELGVDFVEMDAKQKLPAYERMLEAAGVVPEEVAMIGDDLPDYPLIIRVGLGIAVADAVDEVKEVAGYVTQKPGGRGAVREAVELILKAQGKWDGILSRYLG